MINTQLEQYIHALEGNFESIPDERKLKIKALEHYIVEKYKETQRINLNFICTHNSRRSQLAQIWCCVAAHYYNIKYVHSYSGGTEATAFHENAVKAIGKAGFTVVKKNDSTNPVYIIGYDDEEDPVATFSKVYNDAVNPSEAFAAVMVCDDADAHCPYISGAEFRISISYEDPKNYDGTHQQDTMYDKRCREIATEMFYLFASIQKKI